MMAQGLVERRPSAPQVSVSLDSRGGSVDAAIEIGRNLRKIRAIATMGEDNVCFSACVFILAGATQRLIGGSVGIHRPYSEQTGVININEAQREYSRLSQKAKTFLRDMNIPEDLYESMVRIPPEEIRLLDSQELSAFGLNQPDPVESHFHDSLYSQQYGLTKQDYLRRKSLSKKVCNSALQSGNASAYNACNDRVMKTGK
ncbi:MAG: COG3904 family protein [Thiobacillus sp.]